MATPAIVQTNLTHEEYFSLEEELRQKFEYISGEVFAMTGGSINHSLISANITGILMNAFRETPCLVLNSDGKLFIEAQDRFFHPDAMVSCEEKSDQYIQSPKIIIEVLSPSTADYDHGEKFSAYRTIASLQTYIMLHQKTPLAEVFQRGKAGSWILNEYSGLEAIIELKDGIMLAMAELYLKVKF